MPENCDSNVELQHRRGEGSEGLRLWFSQQVGSGSRYFTCSCLRPVGGGHGRINEYERGDSAAQANLNQTQKYKHLASIRLQRGVCKLVIPYQNLQGVNSTIWPASHPKHLAWSLLVSSGGDINLGLAEAASD